MIKKYEIKPILTGDVHYANPEDNRLQDVLIAINEKKPVGQAFALNARHLNYASVEDFIRMNKDFGYNYPEDFLEKCIENTLEVANKCNFEFETDIDKYPKYEPTSEVVQYFKTENTKEIITKLSHAKLNKKLIEYEKENILKITPEIKQKYIDRLNFELKVIEDKNMLDYFLVVWEIIRFCEQNNIATGPGRGCFVTGTRVKMSDGLYCPIDMIQIGEEVIDAFGNKQKVIDTLEYNIDEEIVELEFENNIKIKCTKEHEFLTKNRSWVKAIDLNEEDDIITI